MSFSHFAISEYLKQWFELAANIDIGFEFFTVIFMHTMNNGLPTHLITLPPFVFTLLHAIYHLFASFTLDIKF